MNKLSFISERATKLIEDELKKLSEPGGLIHFYDEVTGSLINICVKKNGADIDFLSWSVYGPMSFDDAARELAREMSIPIPKKPVSCH